MSSHKLQNRLDEVEKKLGLKSQKIRVVVQTFNTTFDKSQCKAAYELQEQLNNNNARRSNI